MYDYSFAGQYREGKKAIVPPTKEDRDFLSAIDTQTKIDLREMFGVTISVDWHCNTIANYTVEAIIKAININMQERGLKSYKFNFYDLFIVKVSTKINEDAEKEGNINVSFEPGPSAVKLISNTHSRADTPVERTTFMDFFTIVIPNEDPNVVAEINDFYSKIDQQARYVLSNNYAIAIPNSGQYMAFGVCYIFIRNIFEKLLRDFGEHPESGILSVNFNDNIEFHISKVDSEDEDEDESVAPLVRFSMRPGLNAKILIKSDETTEDDEMEDAIGI